MSNTPEKEYYEIIDIKKQTKEHSQYRKYSGASIVCPYNEVDFSNVETKPYEKTYKKQQDIPNTVRGFIPSAKKQNKLKENNTTSYLIIAFIFIAGLTFLSLIILSIFFPEGYHYSSKDSHSIIGHFFGTFLCFLFLAFFLGLYFIPQMLISKAVNKGIPKVSDALQKYFTKPTLPEMKKTFFNALKIEYYLIEEVYSQVENISAIMAKINSSYKKYVRTDDFISFNYKNSPVDIVEFRSVGRAANSCIFVRTKINRVVPNETYIKSKEPSANALSFADNFSVQSVNPPEARKFFTTAFMKNLLKYKKGHNNCSVDIYLNSKLSDRENVFICIISQKNFFEMLESDWNDTNNSYKIIAEIKEILEIVDVLNQE